MSQIESPTHWSARFGVGPGGGRGARRRGCRGRRDAPFAGAHSIWEIVHLTVWNEVPRRRGRR
jgi:hypothetical protein